MDLISKLVGGQGCAADGAAAARNPLARLVDGVLETAQVMFTQLGGVQVDGWSDRIDRSMACAIGPRRSGRPVDVPIPSSYRTTQPGGPPRPPPPPPPGAMAGARGPRGASTIPHDLHAGFHDGAHVSHSMLVGPPRPPPPLPMPMSSSLARGAMPRGVDPGWAAEFMRQGRHVPPPDAG